MTLSPLTAQKVGNVECGMTSLPLDNTHGRTTSSVTCNHRLWTAHMVGLRRVWHDITSLGQHTRSNDVGHGMPSSPLDNTHSRKSSGMACHHIPWTTNTVERCRAWQAIIAFGQHTQSNDVGCGMTSPPLDSPHDRTTSSVAFHYRLWEAHTVERPLAWHAIIAFGKHKRSNNVRRGMTSPP